MNDKELLEMAAKAAGYRLDGMFTAKNPDDMLLLNERGGHSVWNPLAYDGDALRLAVKLKIDIHLYNGGIETVWVDEDLSECHETVESCDEKHDGWDAKHAATRRAIVRAAAEIGKDMP